MQEKNKMAQEGYRKNNNVSKIVKKNILVPYDGNDSILFDISKCHWLPGGGGGGFAPPPPPIPFSTYNRLSETINIKLRII